MVGSRKLSNDEVEALLSGLDSESKEDGTQQFDPNEVREFKFGTEDLSLLGDFLTDNKKELNKRCEVMLHRIFPEKSREQIKEIKIYNEEELLSKISEINFTK